MPIYEIACNQCGFTGEVIELNSQAVLKCPSCGGKETRKMMSASSSLSGKNAQHMPGPADTGCCGSTPGHAGCAGPGSCCGKTG